VKNHTISNATIETGNYVLLVLFQALIGRVALPVVAKFKSMHLSEEDVFYCVNRRSFCWDLFSSYYFFSKF